MKEKIRTMGNFTGPATRNKVPKFCKYCGKPVSETAGNSGYCKECIELAKEVKQNEYLKPVAKRPS